MLLQQERELVVEYGKKLITAGLTKGTGGNVSVLNREQGLFALSPSGMDYFTIEPWQVAVLDLEGNLVDAPYKPSTEHELHRRLYVERPDMNGVVHAHTNYATVLSCLRKPLPPLHYLIALAGYEVPCAEYATFGSAELAENVVRALNGNRAALMANHGMIAGAKTVQAAFRIVEEVEYCAMLYCQAIAMGQEPVLLPKEEMERHFELFATYGKPAVTKENPGC
ncbi:MAG: L-fuculose-phosphate aldolase [Clostridia bacterium]|nr:L-fuculose-phosphate aldolase [Clostridia bacterium]